MGIHRKVLKENKNPYLETIRPREGTLPYTAITDWLSCTFQFRDEPRYLAEFFRELEVVLGEDFSGAEDRKRGINGWQRSYMVGKSNAVFGIGGQRGTAYLSFPGEACTLIRDECWEPLADLLGGEYHATITRWDGAVDDLIGKHSPLWAWEQYELGRFSTGGNQPEATQMGDWLKHFGKGRTLNIADRKNGKMMRIYEKGKQLGDPESPWTRWEVELHNNDRFIPWEVLTNVGGYVAGSYEVMDWMKVETSRVKTFKNAAEISYNALVGHARNGYGALINVMIDREGSAEKVIAKLIRPGIPKRLQLTEPPKSLPVFDKPEKVGD